MIAAADQGGNGSGSSSLVRCTGSAQTVQVTAGTNGDGYAAGQAFVSGTLYLSGPSYLSATTGEAVWGDVASTGGIVTITEG